jgi:hypothetical protein
MGNVSSKPDNKKGHVMSLWSIVKESYKNFAKGMLEVQYQKKCQKIGSSSDATNAELKHAYEEKLDQVKRDYQDYLLNFVDKMPILKKLESKLGAGNKYNVEIRQINSSWAWIKQKRGIADVSEPPRIPPPYANESLADKARIAGYHGDYARRTFLKILLFGYNPGHSDSKDVALENSIDAEYQGGIADRQAGRPCRCAKCMTSH